MLKDERRKKICDIVGKEGSVTSNELSARFKVTQQTIRRDLYYLDSQAMIKKTFGGAIKLQNDSDNFQDPSFDQRKITFLNQKNRIAKAAAGLIEQNDTIAIDSSTTTLQMIQYLPEDKNITVITNSLSALVELAKKNNITIVTLGGQFRKSSTSFLGNLATNNLRLCNIDKCFLSGNSVSIKRGLMDPHAQETEQKKAFLETAEKTILLVNSEKFNTISTYTVCPLLEFDAILTDVDLASDICDEIRALGINIQIL